jgi:hemolysin III
MTKALSKRVIVEEVFNSITHGIGSLLSITAILLLLLLPGQSLTATIVLIFFGTTLFITYTISTLYHSLTFTKAKKVFQILDHASIFLLIAGTYTALIIHFLPHLFGTILLAIVWIGSIWGIVQKSIWVDKWKKLTLVLYLTLGWIGVLLAKPLLHVLSVHSLIFLLLGGVFYSSGITFYLWKKLPFSHMIWHLFVLVGSVCHFLAIYFV